MVQTEDGGYVITGETRSFGAGSCDVYLVKTDASGDTVWTRTFGGGGDYGRSVAQTTDGGYIIVGYTMSFGAGEQDVYLVKTNATGDTAWTRTYGGGNDDRGYSVVQTADDGYVITGRTWSFGAGRRDIWLIKTDASGDTMWTHTYGGERTDEGYSVTQTADGGYVIAGWTKSFGAGGYDVYLVKTDAWGDTLWTRTYGGADYDFGFSVVQTTDGGYVIAGYTRSFGAGYDDIYLVKTDASGDTIWTRTYGGPDPDCGFSVLQNADGGYVIAGGTRSFSAGRGDVYLVKTDANGDTVWTRTWGGTNFDDGRSVAQTTDGGYIIAGVTESFGAGDPDVYLIKTDANGNIAIAEPQPPVAHEPATATIVRGVLRMPETGMTNAQYPMTLLDISGREVAKLHPGENDVRHLAPGVYFVRPAGTAFRAKVIIQR